MFDSFNNCLIVVRYGFNLVFVVRMVLDVRLNWLYDVKKEKPHPIFRLPFFNRGNHYRPIDFQWRSRDRFELDFLNIQGQRVENQPVADEFKVKPGVLRLKKSGLYK